MKEPEDVWSAVWDTEPDLDRILFEERTLRWKRIESEVLGRWTRLDGLRVVEIGSGHGTNALHFARRGASVTMFDREPAALAGARRAADALGVEVTTVEGDLFDLADDLRGAFDVSCSFGLCEHFVDAQRTAVVAAHLELLAPGGVAAIGVPNRWSWPYRAWMAALQRWGTWPFGLEVPFTAGELRRVVEAAGGTTVDTGYGSFPATLVNYLVSPVLLKAGRRSVLAPEWRTPLDFMAYELLVLAERARAS